MQISKDPSGKREANMNTEFKYELLEEDFIQSNLDYVKISPNFAKQMRIIK